MREIKIGFQMCWYGYTKIHLCSWKIEMLTLTHEEDATQIFEWIYLADEKHSTPDAPGGGGRGYSNIWATLRYGP